MTGKHDIFVFAGAILVFAASLTAQEVNTTAAQMNVNGPLTYNLGFLPVLVGSPVLGVGPLETTAFIGSVNVVRLSGAPSMPVLIAFGAYQPNAFTAPNFGFDLADAGGFYANQILLSGFSNGPQPGAQTNATGTLQISMTLTCPVSGAGACAAFLPAVTALQSVIGDATNAPLFIRSTAASVISVFDGPPTTFTLTGDNSQTFSFPPGFVFNFYGTNYTNCFVSANGFISFGATDTGFPSPSVATVRAGVRRIMTFYQDLEPQVSTSAYTTRVFAHSFVDAGQTKVRVVQENLSEFADSTGPHGGEIVMSQNGDIEIFMPPYCQTPSINTVFGITPGANIDSGFTPVPGQTPFGRDLTADANLGPTPLGINRIGFELFDYGAIPFMAPVNPLDLVGFGFTPGALYSPGVRFLRNPLVTGVGQAEYIVQ